MRGIGPLVLSGLIIVVVWVGGCHGFARHYCQESYSTRVQVQEVYYIWCGRTRYTRKRWVWRTVQKARRVCCTGWRGCYCHIPICDQQCTQNRGLCVSPNNCACPSTRIGPNCQIKTCGNWKLNCYPGTCANTQSCACSSGFEGSNCNTMNIGPEWKKCEVKLTASFGGAYEVSTECKTGTMEEEEADVPLIYTKMTNLEDIDLNWEVAYVFPPDRPIKPAYIQRMVPGITKNTADMNIKQSGASLVDQSIVCELGTPEVPWLSPECRNRQFNVRRKMNHKDILEIEFAALTGGFKEVHDSDWDKLVNQTFTGVRTTRKVRVYFDQEAPYHCTEDNSCGMDPIPEPLFVLEDITQRPNFTIFWTGWEDRDSRVNEFGYYIYRMELNEVGILEETGEPIVQKVWPAEDNVFPNIFPEDAAPGMYSAVLEVKDIPGNIARARTLVMLDTNSKIDIDENYPVRLTSSNQDSRYTWITELKDGQGNDDIKVSWTKHFINKRHVQQGLLKAVGTYAGAGKINYDDSDGRRTTAPIDNSYGIVNFDAAYILHSGSRRKRQAEPTYETLGTDVEKTITFSRKDGDRMQLFLRATDAVGVVKEETLDIGVDSTPPDVGTTVFSKNIPVELKYGSRVEVTASDPHSGISHIEWKLFDITAGEELLRNGSSSGTMSQQGIEFCRVNAGCYCTNMGECFAFEHYVEINNCLMIGRESDEFKLEIRIRNKAFLYRDETVQFGPFIGLSGIGEYPGVNVTEAEIDATSALLRWTYPEACYTYTSLTVEYESSDGRNKAIVLDINKNSVLIKDLSSGENQLVTFYLNYEDGNIGKTTHEFFTPMPQGSVMSAGGKAGVAIGVILLLLVLLLVLCLCYRRRKRKPLLPIAIQNSLYFIPGVKKNTYKEENSSMMIRNNLKSSSNNYADPTKGFGQEIKGDLVRKYGGALEDDVYTYGTMDFGASNSHSVSHDKMSIGKEIASGRFALIKEAVLYDKTGDKEKVAAKMNKADASEADKLLMTAKMNFLASGITDHDNLVNLVAALPADPIIFLELCEEGPVLQWIKKQSDLSTEVIDLLTAFCLDTVTGLEHLHNHGVIHRRLAARNVLLTQGPDRLMAKITGFGPMRGEEDPSSDTDNRRERIPAKWLAPESLEKPRGEQRIYNEKTDIWSYGITIWEILSQGQKPYENRKHGEMKKALENGEKLEKTDNCSDFIYHEVMLPCWELDPDCRPEADQIRKTLSGLFGSDGTTDDNYYYDDKNP